MKKIIGIMVVLAMLCSGIVYAGVTSSRWTATGLEITDTGEIPVVTGTRYSSYSAGVCSGATVTIYPSRGSVQTLTLASHSTCTINWVQPSEGVQTVSLLVTQGSASAPMAWASTLWPSGTVSTMSGTTGAIDVITCRLTGSQVFCSSSQNYL